MAAPPRLPDSDPGATHRGIARLLLITTTLAGVLLLGMLWLGRRGHGHPMRPDIPCSPSSLGTPWPGPQWVWQLSPRHAQVHRPAYEDLLRHLPPSVRILVVAPERTQVEELVRDLGGDPRLAVLGVDTPLSSWARDRYVVFRRHDGLHALVPHIDRPMPTDAGDVAVPARLAASGEPVHVHEATFRLEGGDLLLTPRRVLIGATSIARNAGDLRGRRAANLVAHLEELFGRPVVVVGDARVPLPYEHLDMFLSVIDDGVVLLGDPRLALNALPARGRGKAEDRWDLGELGAFRRSTQNALIPTYERLGASLRASGFRVRRVPILHGDRFPDGRRGAVLSWNNALIVEDGGRRHVFVPRYDVGDLEREAHAVWRDLGFVVHAIDCRQSIIRGGAVRCLTNVVPPITERGMEGVRPEHAIPQ